MKLSDLHVQCPGARTIKTAEVRQSVRACGPPPRRNPRAATPLCNCPGHGHFCVLLQMVIATLHPARLENEV